MGANQSLAICDADAPLIDQAVFEERVAEVLVRMQSSVEERPFEAWDPQGNPAEDATWMLFGYDVARGDFPEGYYSYDSGLTDSSKRRALALKVKVDDLIEDMNEKIRERLEALQETHGTTETSETREALAGSNVNRHVLHAFRAALKRMTADECGFPAAPMIAHHHMIKGEFQFVDGWPVPIYIQNQSNYGRPGADFIAALESHLLRTGLVKAEVPALPSHAVLQNLQLPARRNFEQAPDSGLGPSGWRAQGMEGHRGSRRSL